MATTLQILRKARKLIEKPERWIKGALARNRKGHSVDESERSAVCYCALGALNRASHFAAGDALGALKSAAGLSPGDSLMGWNDAPRRTHAQVLRAFDKAIAKLEASGKAVQR